MDSASPWLSNNPLTSLPTPSPIPMSLALRAGGREGVGSLSTDHQDWRSKRPLSWGGHPCSPGAFSPQGSPTGKSLSEGNQPGSAGRWGGEAASAVDAGLWATETPRGSRPPPSTRTPPPPPSLPRRNPLPPGPRGGSGSPGRGRGGGGRSERTPS